MPNDRKKKRDLDAVMGQGPDLIKFYRENPCIAAYELLGVDLAPIQRVIFEDMWFKSFVLLVASRGLGKTYLNGLLAALSCMLIPGYRVGLIGPAFRQSKNMFNEVVKLYDKSSILREATEKRPISGSDSSYLKFKGIGDSNGSFIEALPLGTDGAKIRGSRFYLVCVDELAQVPSKILDMVLKPMGATKLDPMKQVRELERKKVLIASGLATEDDFEEETVNKMIMSSSGYYKFNHMYARMRNYWDDIELNGEKSKYAVYQIPYTLLPDGFLDSTNIEGARRTMSDMEFRMEYMAEMISDSEGFFKATLLEACTTSSTHLLMPSGNPEKQYIMGIDPNQGGSASCGLVIVELGIPSKIVNVMELKKYTTQELTMTIQEMCDIYNIKRIYMDKGGGGNAICDLLEEGYNNKAPIIDRTNPDHKLVDGRHILELVNFSPGWISDANYATLSLFEDRKLIFPRPPLSTIDDKVNDKIEDDYEKVVLLKKQLLNIVVTQTSSGYLHFDTPKKGQNKDLYSALILAGYGVRAHEKDLDEEQSILFNSNGLVRSNNPGSSWDQVRNGGGIGPVNTFGVLHKALLKKKRIK
jgi:hypothetical protein